MNSPLIPRWFFVVVLVLGLVGFIDATYLATEHFLGEIPPCTLTQGCETVTTSSYSVVFGVPVALLGAVYYLVVLAFTIWLWDRRDPKLLKLFGRLTWIGLLAAIYFTSVQAFILQAWCQYCLVSAAASVLIFAVVQYVAWHLPQPKEQETL